MPMGWAMDLVTSSGRAIDPTGTPTPADLRRSIEAVGRIKVSYRGRFKSGTIVRINMKKDEWLKKSVSTDLDEVLSGGRFRASLLLFQSPSIDPNGTCAQVNEIIWVGVMDPPIGMFPFPVESSKLCYYSATWQRNNLGFPHPNDKYFLAVVAKYELLSQATFYRCSFLNINFRSQAFSTIIWIAGEFLDRDSSVEERVS
ncbi:hypothetical protein F5X96DRAFT_642145 [Biscogniauxia mediterranea]|nr:hypothetical protein F5X96DRAFT_642145 [Biscogniauxia mediterranea]